MRDELPVGLVEAVIEARRYMQAKQTYDHARTRADLPQTPMIARVRAVDFALAEDEHG